MRNANINENSYTPLECPGFEPVFKLKTGQQIQVNISELGYYSYLHKNEHHKCLLEFIKSIPI